MSIFRLLTLLLSILTLTAYSKSPLDSLVDAKVSTQMKLHLDRMSKINDSLRNELVYFKAKEDQYSLLVDRQGTHFEFIIGVVVNLFALVFGLIGYGLFRSIEEKVDGAVKITNRLQTDIEVNIENQKQKFEKLEGKINEELDAIKVSLYTISAHTLTGNFISSIALDDIEGLEEKEKRKLRSANHVLKQIYALKHRVEVYKYTRISKDRQELEKQISSDISILIKAIEQFLEIHHLKPDGEVGKLNSFMQKLTGIDKELAEELFKELQNCGLDVIEKIIKLRSLILAHTEAI